MSKTQPIKELNDIKKLENYFLERQEIRNYVLIVMGLNTSLRISDILNLRWCDLFNFKSKNYRKHIIIDEQKTGKHSIIAINKSILSALDKYRKTLNKVEPELYVFTSRIGNNRPISRNRAFHIIKNAVGELGIENNISCHSLRKTFGYHAWKNGVPPALLQQIYNHSSYEITKRYLGITQDEKDDVFLNILL